MQITVPLPIDVDGRRVGSETTVTRHGGYVVAISTVIPERPFAVELHSTYVGHPDGDTISTELVLALALDEPRSDTRRHHSPDMDVLGKPRNCLYDHAMQLQEFLAGALAHDARIHVGAGAIAALEPLA
ncbi:MAG: hypothetical protein AB7I23_25330 [Vicinamibacterales bacterium]